MKDLEGLRKLVEKQRVNEETAKEHSEGETKSLNENLKRLHDDIGTYVDLMKDESPKGTLALTDINWNDANLHPDVLTFLRSEFTFQPDEITLSIKTGGNGETQRYIAIAIDRLNKPWSSVRVDTWSQNEGGIMVGTSCVLGTSQVKEAREAGLRLTTGLHSRDEFEKYSKRFEVGREIFNFAVEETVRQLEVRMHPKAQIHQPQLPV